MSKKNISILKIEELEKMNTKQLLARLKNLLSCENSFECSDLSYDLKLNPSNLYPDFIFYKQTELWQQAYNDVKDILKTREHIIKGIELKNLRLEKVKNSKKFLF